MTKTAHHDDPAALDIAAVLETEQAALSLPTRLEWIERAARFLCDRAVQCGACDEGRSTQLVIALHEALTNAIVHGNLEISSALKQQAGDAFARALAERSADPVLSSRRVEVRLGYDGETCTISIADEGGGFDFARWIEQPDEPDLEQPSGRGIFLMKAFVDALEYRDAGRECVMTLRRVQPHERRTASRHAWASAVRVILPHTDATPNGEQIVSGISRDVSADGLSVVGPQAVSAERVLVEMRTEGRTHYVPAEVCRVTPLDGGLFELGCRFSPDGFTGADRCDTTPPPAAVAALLHKLEQTPAGAERRAHSRVSYTARIEVRATGSSIPYRPAFSRDLSRGGIAFVASFELKPGPIDLILPGPDGQGEHHVPAHVIRCQRVTAGVFDVACQFA